MAVYGEWLEQDIDKLLELLPVMEEAGFVVATWPDREPAVQGEIVAQQMPYPTYHAVIDQFIALVSNSTLACDPYAILPEDPPGLVAGTGTTGVLQTANQMQTATLGQLRRYFMLCARGERFCEGYVDGQFQTGALVAAFRRLKSLREA